MEQNRISRRRFIGAGSVVALGGVAGCEGVMGGVSSGGPESANFTFEYAPEEQRLTITHDGGGAIPADALSINSSRGKRIAWSELGSTSETGDEEVTDGSSAVLGPTIINWEQPVTRTELVRVVFAQEDGSVTTLGRFESELTATAEPTATPTPEVVFSDDFEDGTLDGYSITSFPRDKRGGDYQITTEPSLGDYAVICDTEDKLLTPRGEPTLEPPTAFSFDFYVEGMAGIDVVLQHDPERNLAYAVKFRSNFNGKFVQVVKNRNPYEDPQNSTELKATPRPPSAFALRRWERANIDWARDGTITATIESTGQSVQLVDEELSGHPFRLLGYNYDGWSAFDNIHVER